LHDIYIILNPYAGRGAAGRRQAELERQLRAVGVRYTLARTSARGAGVELAQRALEQGYTTIAAVGGDGTISEIANGIMQAAQGERAAACLAPIPIGTGNDFVKMFPGVVANDLVGAAARLARGQTRTIDVGRVNGHYFINVVGMGIDAQVTIESLKVPALTGFAVYLAGVARALAVYKARAMQVRYDDAELGGPALFLNVSNGRSHGGGFKLTPTAENDDGLLDLCFVKQMPLFQIVRHFPKVLNGTHTTLPWVTMGRARRIEVSAPAGTPLAADGEVLDERARVVSIETLPHALAVVC
jgi:diacylglycerol kinase (ATP)